MYFLLWTDRYILQLVNKQIKIAKQNRKYQYVYAKIYINAQ